MSFFVELDPAKLTVLRERDPRQQSYNIEMTELTGGTFWAPYTPGQVAGVEEYPTCDDPRDMVQLLRSMMTKLPPIDLYEPRIRTLAKALGPVIVRFSGSWATRTYYDFDGHTGEKVPNGFEFILTKEQWQGALNFVKAVGGQILVSVANSAGVHEKGTGPWMPDQAEVLWNYTQEQGLTINYAEFMNEPNMMEGAGLPDCYSSADFARDQDLFARWIRNNHPECKLVGPCSADGPRLAIAGGSMVDLKRTDELLKLCDEMPEIFSYHSYNGISERGQMFGTHHDPSVTTSEEYLGLTMQDLYFHEKLRDSYMPGADMWVTESADAACGGNTWAPTFVETIRYIDEMARFSINTHGVIFHNTLASSAYGLLDSETHQPRPQYWGGLLFNTLVGNTVYDTHEPIREGIHVYAFSRKDGLPGICYIYINNSREENAKLMVPECVTYTLSANCLRSQQILLNGHILSMQSETVMPPLEGTPQKEGPLYLNPCTITFLIAKA